MNSIEANPEPSATPARVAIVTGSGGMIAGAVALGLAAGGTRVVLVDRREESVGRYADDVRRAGGTALPITADVSRADGADKAVRAALDTWSRVDMLVNVAGGIKGPLKNPIWEMTDEQWERTLAANLHTVYQCTRHVVRPMMQQRSGRIVNIASTSWAGSPDHAHYAAAKAGVVAFTRSVASQLGPFGITVNAVAPGGTLTDAARLPGFPAEEAWKTMNPLGRPNEPEDVADAVLFLVSERARNISGQLITVAGGVNPSL